MIEFKENELYQEIEIFLNDKKIGDAEVELKGKMLSRLSIFPPYQNKGYGTQIVKMLNEKYGCNSEFGIRCIMSKSSYSQVAFRRVYFYRPHYSVISVFFSADVS